MQKYKIVASKSQKKYTLIISADSESQAKEKLHKEGYSILSVQEAWDNKIIWNKFLFQIEKDGEVKNGVIVGKDIFKVYIKLRDELWYNIVFLYPEGDEAHNNAEKKQKIIGQLIKWYDLQQKVIKQKKTNENKEESFYLQKELNETYLLLAKAIEKFDSIFNNRENYNLDNDTFYKLEKIYEKLIHVKWSTNLSKLKEIWELALIKVAKIELQNVEKNKDKESRDLLKETNNLLKKIGSSRHFIEEDKDIKKKIQSFFNNISKALIFHKKWKNEKWKWNKNLIDKDSYNFLKTVLLLEKYQDKLDTNSKEIKKNIKLFINPLSKSTYKEKIYLKRKVIRQNISILKAKKSWWITSYTWVKKWYGKITNVIFYTFGFLWEITTFFVYAYITIFLSILSLKNIEWFNFQINTYPIVFLLLGFILIFFLHISKNLILLSLNIVFFSFIFIFSLVNF
jgi:hypothetical protein